MPEDIQFLDSDPFRCRALHYDAVYNGNELGSGSIRITDPALQQRIFGLLGIADGRDQARFGFLLDGAGGGRATARRLRDRVRPGGDAAGGRDVAA